MEPAYVIEEDDLTIRGALIKMLKNKNLQRLELPSLFPKFLKVNVEVYDFVVDWCLFTSFSNSAGKKYWQ